MGAPLSHRQSKMVCEHILVYQAYAPEGQINPAQGNALGLRVPKENPPRSAILSPPCLSRVGRGLQNAGQWGGLSTQGAAPPGGASLYPGLG